MTIERRNPPGLHPTPGYHHATISTARRYAFLAGQCPLDADGVVVGPDDLVAQVNQVAHNIATALEAIGAAPEDVVRTVIYVASTERADLALVWTALSRSEVGAALSTASTLLGVAQLGYPGQLVEVDVTAALG
ncbi:MAG TPA: RidA family protein [Mycobacteriales bacterium]|nr:RidA family protein [Mycobacteriales bacterium]